MCQNILIKLNEVIVGERKGNCKALTSLLKMRELVLLFPTFLLRLLTTPREVT